MSLEAIAALLKHRSFHMTLVYAKIADRTVADEYIAVSEKVEALYQASKQLPADAEGVEMRKLHGDASPGCSATATVPGRPDGRRAAQSRRITLRAEPALKSLSVFRPQSSSLPPPKATRRRRRPRQLGQRRPSTASSPDSIRTS